MLSQAAMIRGRIRSRIRTYLSHSPPQCSAADQLLCVLPIALSSSILRIKESCQRLFDAYQRKDVPVSSRLVPSPAPLNRLNRVYSTSGGACIPLCSRPSFWAGDSLSILSRSHSYRSMATAGVLPPSNAMRPRFEAIIQGGTSSRRYNGAFDPEKHLAFIPPSKIYTMKDLNLDDIGVSPVAVSEPFPLFSPEAIQNMRAEVLSEQVWNNCQYSSNLAQCQLRGFAPEYVLPASP